MKIIKLEDSINNGFYGILVEDISRLYQEKYSTLVYLKNNQQSIRVKETVEEIMEMINDK